MHIFKHVCSVSVAISNDNFKAKDIDIWGEISFVLSSHRFCDAVGIRWYGFIKSELKSWLWNAWGYDVSYFQKRTHWVIHMRVEPWKFFLEKTIKHLATLQKNNFAKMKVIKKYRIRIGSLDEIRFLFLVKIWRFRVCKTSAKIWTSRFFFFFSCSSTCRGFGKISKKCAEDLRNSFQEAKNLTELVLQKTPMNFIPTIRKIGILNRFFFSQNWK